LVVANLKKEIDDMTRKEEELEKRWKAKESEIAEALASTKAELNLVKMEKRRAEEDRSLADKKVEALVFQNNMVVVKLKNELDELTRRKDELEEISKAKEEQVCELKISYDNLLKEIQRVQGELQKETHEKMERESFFSIRKEEMLIL
jgi:DNA repair exonuclease SbcCD ATPase subunit